MIRVQNKNQNFASLDNFTLLKKYLNKCRGTQYKNDIPSKTNPIAVGLIILMFKTKDKTKSAMKTNKSLYTDKEKIHQSL